VAEGQERYFTPLRRSVMEQGLNDDVTWKPRERCGDATACIRWASSCAGKEQLFGRKASLGNRQGVWSLVVSFPTMAVSDTTPRAAAIQLQLYRNAGPSRRAQIAVELSDAVRETALAGIRRRHPDYTEEQVKSTFLRLVYDFGE